MSYQPPSYDYFVRMVAAMRDAQRQAKKHYTAADVQQAEIMEHRVDYTIKKLSNQPQESDQLPLFRGAQQ